MAIVYNVLAAVTILVALLVIFNNFTVPVDFQLMGKTYESFTLGIIMASMLLFGVVGTFFRMLVSVGDVKTQNKRLKREVERKEVATEDSDSQVKVLEAKIKTLERSLEMALDSSEEANA